ncbi:hypothetical protein Tco_0246615 [Tanacetum coccineum]
MDRDGVALCLRCHLYALKVSRVPFKRITKEQWAQHTEAAVSYADLRASIKGYYEENVDHKEQTKKVIDATMNSLNKNSIAMGDLLNALNGVTKTLKAIQDAVKEDPVLNKKGLKSLVESLHATTISQDKHLAKWAKSSTSLAWSIGLRMTGIENSQATIRMEVSSLRHDTSDIKSLMTEIYQAFKGQSSTPSSSVPQTTLAITGGPINFGGRIAKEGEKFKKAQDAELKVLNKERNEKLRKSLELRKHKYENYMWTIDNRLKPEKIIDVKIHPHTKLVVVTVYRITDKRTFEVHNPFMFGAFGISELDKLREIIPKNKNVVVKDLMNSLSRRYERIKKILEELGIKSALPAPILE